LDDRKPSKWFKLVAILIPANQSDLLARYLESMFPSSRNIIVLFSFVFVQFSLVCVLQLPNVFMYACLVVAPHPSKTNEENEAQKQAEASTKVCGVFRV